MPVTESTQRQHHFDPSLFLYTRTDHRGVIKEGNQAFATVSAYQPEEMIGAPHKIVRHPDMPRALFQTMWQLLGEGRSLSAYVKNRAKDGGFYWVFATVMPRDNDYISIRMAPRSAYFEIAQRIMAGLRAGQADRHDPAVEAARLQEAVVAEGLRDYADFMVRAIVEEMKCHSNGMIPEDLSRMLDLRARLADLAGAQKDLLSTFSTLYLVPTNMRILASRLEPSGGPISAIADSYKRNAAELITRLQGGKGSGKDTPPQGGDAGSLSVAMDTMVFDMASAALLRVADKQLAREPIFGRVEGQTDDKLSHAARNEIIARARRQRLDHVIQGLQNLRREAEVVKSLMTGLDQVRILGEVESGRLRSTDNGLAAIMGQLHDYHQKIHAHLNGMIGLSTQLAGIAA